MRADRLLSILLLLQVHRRLTARELAARLEVSPRTIHRDMEALSAAGVPVYALRGAAGGWVLPDEYRTDAAGLHEAEVRALFLATPARLLADLGLDRAAEAALIKLLAALPAAGRRGADDVRQRIHLDVAGWHPSEETAPHLAALQEAVWRGRRLRLGYERHGGATVEREVDPLGLVAKGSVWYLVAAAEGEPRTYRVSRVREATVLDQPCVRPEGFDLPAFWEASKARFVTALPRYPVTLRVDPALIPELRTAGRWSRVEQVDPPGADGWSGVRMRFELREDARACALGFGPRLEVLEPADLREEVARLAAGIVDLYAPRASGAPVGEAGRSRDQEDGGPLATDR